MFQYFLNVLITFSGIPGCLLSHHISWQRDNYRILVSVDSSNWNIFISATRSFFSLLVLCRPSEWLLFSFTSTPQHEFDLCPWSTLIPSEIFPTAVSIWFVFESRPFRTTCNRLQRRRDLKWAEEGVQSDCDKSGLADKVLSEILNPARYTFESYFIF